MLGFVLYASLVLLPLYLQTLMGYPAYNSGLALSPRGIGALLFTPLAGHLTTKTDPRRLLVVGIVLGSITMFQLSGLNLYAGLDLRFLPNRSVDFRGMFNEAALAGGAWRRLFEAVTDKTKLESVEMPAYWRLMRWARAQSFAELAQRARPAECNASRDARPGKRQGYIAKDLERIRPVQRGGLLELVAHTA